MEDQNKNSDLDKQIVERLELLKSLIGDSSAHIGHSYIPDENGDFTLFAIKSQTRENGIHVLQKYLNTLQASGLIDKDVPKLKNIPAILTNINDNEVRHIEMGNFNVFIGNYDSQIVFAVKDNHQDVIKQFDEAIEVAGKEAFNTADHVANKERRNIKPQEMLPPSVEAVSHYLIEKIYEVSAIPKDNITISHKIAGADSTDYTYSIVIRNADEGKLSDKNLNELIKTIDKVLRVDSTPLYDEQKTHTGFKFTGKPENLLAYIRYNDKDFYNEINSGKKSSMQAGR